MIYYKYFYFSNWVVNICKLKKIEIYEVSFFYELSAVSWRNVSWLLQIWKKNHLRFVRLLPSWIEEILDDKFSFTNIAFKWLLLSWTFFEKKNYLRIEWLLSFMNWRNSSIDNKFSFTNSVTTDAQKYGKLKIIIKVLAFD